MCSIFAVIDLHSNISELRELAVAQSNLLQHRGPDASGIKVYNNAILSHNRIAIMDVFNGDQPIVSNDGSSAVIANAEIYNHKKIESDLGVEFNTGSDCEAILALLNEKGTDSLDMLNGMFAFVVYDDNKKSFCVARDHVGILSLYYGYDDLGRLYVSSEMKSLEKVCKWFEVFPPGHYLTQDTTKPKPYYSRSWKSYEDVENVVTDKEHLKSSFEKTVENHLMADVPVGILLSGGLDSSLVASLAVRLNKELGGEQLSSYSIGLKGSPDLEAARTVAEYLGTKHFEHIYTVEQGIDAIRSTIYHLESYDVTSVRASVPMYLIARRIRGNGTKVVLTGDGADETFAGYLYFHQAPDAKSLHEECIRKLDAMHMYDCLRANKTMLAWGVEPRVPFLDKGFMDVSMGEINPKDKTCSKDKIEKSLLREVFEGHLPNSVLWRQKEQSSDGVGYGWIDGLKDYAETKISDDDFYRADKRFPVNTPKTKEAYLYREIFEDIFSHKSAVYVAPEGKGSGNITQEASSWLGEDFIDDPSGRAVRSHVNSVI